MVKSKIACQLKEETYRLNKNLRQLTPSSHILPFSAHMTLFAKWNSHLSSLPLSCIMLSDSDEAGCTNPLIKSLPSTPCTPLLSQARKPFPAAALSYFCLMNAFSDWYSHNWIRDAKILNIKVAKCSLRLCKWIFLYNCQIVPQAWAGSQRNRK